LVVQDTRDLTADFFFLVFRALSLAPSPQEIKGQKSSLLPMRKHNDLLRLSVHLVLHFFPFSLASQFRSQLYFSVSVITDLNYMVAFVT
jgi:hypothetical protein